MRPAISIIVPVFRESGNLLNLHARLHAVLAPLDGATSSEIIFVNDGSPDNSWQVIQELASQDQRVLGINLARNFGKELALSAGIHAARGDAVICMDADLQHPPEVIPELIKAWRAGAKIVGTIRTSIDEQPFLRRAGSRLFYWLMSKISGVKLTSQGTDFGLYDRVVIDIFNTMTERSRLFRGMIDWIGFPKTFVEFHASAREAGAAGYSYTKLIGLAVNSITSFSLFPLRITGYLGALISVVSVLLMALMLADRFLLHRIGFSSLALVVVANTFFIGVVLMALGLMAIYIGSIHGEVINRPLYVIAEKTLTRVPANER